MKYNRTHDSVLQNIARKFRSVETLPETDFLYQSQFNALPSYRNMGLTPDRKLWYARFWFGGKTRTFAMADHGREAELARFADLCVIRFWKYRLRGFVPTDADTNFAISRAEQDLKNLTFLKHPAIDLLDEIEKHLLSLGVFQDRPETDETPRKETRLTVRTVLAMEMRELFAGVNTTLNSMFSDNVEFVKSLDLISRRLDGMQDIISRLDGLVARLDSLSAQSAIEAANQDFCRAVAAKANPELPKPQQLADPTPTPPRVVCGTAGEPELPMSPFRNGTGFDPSPASVFSVASKVC